MIDSHCHLDFKQYEGKREEVVAQAIGSGVHTIVNIGTDLKSSVFSVDLAQKYGSVRAAVGVHPHDASTVNRELLDRLRDLAADHNVVAIGEIGLDFYRDRSPRDAQRRAFQEQLELAVELKRPVIIHTREAFDETVEIIKNYASKLKGGVFHCFPGDVQQAQLVIDLGFMVSFGGVITFPKAIMADVAARVPIESVILETDSPFLTPVPYRGKTNYPAYVRFVYEKFAQLRNMSVEQAEKQIDRNCQKLFGLVETFGD